MTDELWLSRRFTMPKMSAQVVGMLAAATAIAAAAVVGPEDVKCDEIVFVKRKPYSSDHSYTDIENGVRPGER